MFCSMYVSCYILSEFTVYKTSVTGCIIKKHGAVKQDIMTIGNCQDGKFQFLYSPNILENTL